MEGCEPGTYFQNFSFTLLSPIYLHQACFFFAGNLVDIVFDEERLLNGRLRTWHILSSTSLRVGLSTRIELVLCCGVFLLLARPDLDARRLESTRVREGESEGTLAVELVDLIEVDARVLFRDAAREEGDARHGRWQAAVECLHSHLSDGGGVRLVRALNTRHGHRWLQQRTLKQHTVILKLGVNRREHALLHTRRGRKLVVAINQNLWLNDGHKPVLLADACITSKVLRGDVDREVCRTACLDVDLERGAPLGKARALLIVLGRALSEIIQASAPVLTVIAATEWLEASVHLDAWDDPIALEDIDERRARGVVLIECLLKKDGA